MKPDFDLAQGWWYPVIVSLVLILIILFIPKRLKSKEIYITFGIVGYIVWTVDTIIAAPFDLFDLATPTKTGLPELLLYGIIPSCLSVIYLNYYKAEKKWTYALLFVVISIILEWLTVKVGLMKLKGWNTLWSLPVHFVFYAFFLPWHIKYIRKQN